MHKKLRGDNGELKIPEPAARATASHHGKGYRPLRGLASSLDH